ncbi:MAG TPA: HAD hydrolase-like protein [Vicinamibacterales bacterium]|nr:HAD hydrolase-like protein [Vicinamibacterales bacterium]
MIIVFDLDGTLIDSARDLAASVGEMLESYGAAALPVDDVLEMVGDGAPLLVNRAMARAGVRPAPDEALSRFLDIYDRRLMDHTAPYAGIGEVLAMAVRRGPLAVLTNKPLGPSIGILEALRLRGFFTRIIGGDGEYSRKPDPKGLLSLQPLCPGDQLVMVGDSPADWKTAAAAAVPFVFARYGFGASKFGASPPDTPYVIDHARELGRVLDAIARRMDADHQGRGG